jgi:hypothetical protein
VSVPEIGIRDFRTLVERWLRGYCAKSPFVAHEEMPARGGTAFVIQNSTAGAGRADSSRRTLPPATIAWRSSPIRPPSRSASVSVQTARPGPPTLVIVSFAVQPLGIGRGGEDRGKHAFSQGRPANTLGSRRRGAVDTGVMRNFGVAAACGAGACTDRIRCLQQPNGGGPEGGGNWSRGLLPWRWVTVVQSPQLTCGGRGTALLEGT